MKGLKKIFLSICVLLFLTGCSSADKQVEGNIYQIYYVNKEQTKVSCNEYITATEDMEGLLEELLKQLGEVPEKLKYKPPLAGKFSLLSYTVENGTITLSFDDYYKEQSPIEEVLTRAAIVRTLTQIDGIDYVTMQIRGEPITDSLGNVVGAMSADMFIDNAGNEINAYEQVKLCLYFANETGDKLIETSRKGVYSSNISMEKLIVEQLIKGPNGEGIYPTINPTTKVISVTVKDGTCYVNLDENFLKQTTEVSAEVTIYSITNSLVELPNVNKVQISVNGETNYMFCESISLAKSFERNLDLVESVK
ncbi:MAG: GerMN domain-containing protein [Lachnospiraceae bacterium]|nr:GerMN domain-containing protein [Lachnospiraceae bacterium]